MERSQNWPDLRSPISKFRDIRFIDTYWYGYQSLKASRESFSRCSFDEHSNFLWGEVWPGDLTLSDLVLKFSQHMRNRCMNRRAKNCFWQAGRKQKGALNSPPPFRAKVKRHRAVGACTWPGGWAPPSNSAPGPCTGCSINSFSPKF